MGFTTIIGLVLVAFGIYQIFKDTGKKVQTIKPAGSDVYDIATGKTMTPAKSYTLDDLYIKHGTNKGVPPALLKALAIVESSENPNAVNPNDPSYGLMQILCKPSAAGCANSLNVLDWPPDSKEMLFDPDYNLHIAAQIIRWNIDNYGFKRGIAIYNRWGSRYEPENGPFTNQSYVDKVLANYTRLYPLVKSTVDSPLPEDFDIGPIF